MAVATLTVKPDSAAPSLQKFTGTTGYTREHSAVRLAPFAELRDAESFKFAGATLVVKVGAGAAESNWVTIGAQANGDIQLGSTVIGKLMSQGFGLSELAVRFNASATPALVQQLLRSIQFRTYGGEAGMRTVEVSLTDWAKRHSLTASKDVKVS